MNKINKIRGLKKFGAASIMGAGLGLMVQPTIATAAGAQTLEEVMVTARKRAENIQDVALSVSAVGKQELERSFARDISQLVNISPNLVIDDTNQGPGGVAAIYIRGIGVADVEKNFDPAVGVAVDGVFIGANSGGILKSMDLQRMEVLRGPQGTLFGRNTIAGVVNLERTKPTGELGGKVRIGYGDYETSNFEGILNVGITDTLAAKFSASSQVQDEGYYTNINTGRDDGRSDYKSYGVNLLWDVSDNLELEYTFQQEETEQDSPALINIGQSGSMFCDVLGFCSQSTDDGFAGDRYKVGTLGPGGMIEDRNGNPIQDPFFATDQHDDATFDADTHILQAVWDINDDYTLTYIYGSWETEETVINDWDGLPALLFHTSRPAEYEQESHELRVTYAGDSAFSWTAGAFLWESEYEIRLNSYIGFRDDLEPILGPGPYDFPQQTNQETDSWAVFFEGDYAFNDQWTLTLGGRYTEDEKSTRQRGAVNTLDDPEETWSEFTPKVGVKYQLSNDTMLYTTYSVGYRSGGFNGRVNTLEEATTPYDPETVDSIELGFKTELLDNTVRLSGALFHMSYDDKQEEIQLPADVGTGQKTVVVNASTATIQGLELDLLAFLTEGFSIRANLGLLDASYDDFEFDNGTSIVDNSNLDFRRAPDLTASLSATYEWDVAGNPLWAQAGVHYIGEHEIGFGNEDVLRNDAQSLVDASINYQYQKFQFSVFGRNLTSEDGYSIGFNVSDLWTYAAPRAPRTWGVEVSYRFGDDDE